MSIYSFMLKALELTSEAKTVSRLQLENLELFPMMIPVFVFASLSLKHNFSMQCGNYQENILEGGVMTEKINRVVFVQCNKYSDKLSHCGHDIRLPWGIGRNFFLSET